MSFNLRKAHTIRLGFSSHFRLTPGAKKFNVSIRFLLLLLLLLFLVAGKAVDMNEPVFDIFRGAIGVDEVWLEAVPGLSNARQRMEDLAAAKPGLYFIYSARTHSIVSCADTRESVLRSVQRRAKIA